MATLCEYLPASTSEPSNTTARRPWWEHLSSLQLHSARHAADTELTERVQQALSAVEQDEAWHASGVASMLGRALQLAKTGSRTGAVRLALNALDFASAYKKLSSPAVGLCRQHSGPRKGAREGAERPAAAGSGGSSSSTSSDVTSTGAHVQAPGTTSTTGTLQAGTGLDAAGTKQGPQVDVFAQPHSKRQRVSGDNAAGAQAASDVQQQQQQQRQQAMQEWTGVLSLLGDDGGRSSDLCSVSLQLPARVAAAMPGAVQFTHLVQRRGVTLGQYQVLRTSISKASQRQLSRLRSLAQHELVAVQALSPHAHLLMVPYTDNQAQLQIVCFYLGA